jgi:hypothetical protein
VVYCDQVTYDRHHAIGKATVVGGRIWKVLDLAHDVVAEKAHQAPMEGRQTCDVGRPEVFEEALERHQNAVISAHTSRKHPLCGEGAT